LQAATEAVNESRKTIFKAQAALQQTGKIHTAIADLLPVALRKLWRSEREELRTEARKFVEEAVSHGLTEFESTLPDPSSDACKPRTASGAAFAAARRISDLECWSMLDHRKV
jgi:hypothetical protein